MRERDGVGVERRGKDGSKGEGWDGGRGMGLGIKRGLGERMGAKEIGENKGDGWSWDRQG